MKKLWFVGLLLSFQVSYASGGQSTFSKMQKYCNNLLHGADTVSCVTSTIKSNSLKLQSNVIEGENNHSLSATTVQESSDLKDKAQTQQLPAKKSQEVAKTKAEKYLQLFEDYRS